MIILVLLVLGISLVPTHSIPKDEYLGTPFLQHCFEEAKKIVDDAYKYSREESLGRVRKDVVSPQEAFQFLMEPHGDTRSAVRSADYMAQTLRLVHDKVHRVHKRSVNATDMLSEDCIKKLAEITGCAARIRPPQCNIIPNLNKYYTITGVCNNLNYPRRGATNTPLARCLPAEYDDYFSSPKGSTQKSHLPLARKVTSCILKTMDADVVNDKQYTQMASAWGQLLAHDISRTPRSPSIKSFSNGVNCRATCDNIEPCLPIMIPPGDSKSGICIPAVRSAPACGTGYSAYNFGGEANKREQLNAASAFIDAETIYGNNENIALSLRNLTNNDGLLNVNLECCDNGREVLPFSHQRVRFCATHGKITHDTSAQELPCFSTGDNRGNQNTGQMALHILFLREHNRLARQLKRLNPHWDSETLYQEARKIVIAEIQVITYRDYLSLIVGQDAMYKYLGPYPGYNPDVDPSLCNVFATAAFRFGHVEVHPVVCRLDENYREDPEFPNVPLFKTFFTPWRICYEGGIDPLLRGLIGCPAKLNTQDHIMPETMTDKLFEFVLRTSQDLGSTNINRGRDHGLPGYNDWRGYCGLSKPSNEAELADVLGNAPLAKKLLDLYKTPNNIDVWVAGLSEPSVRGGRVGPLFACLIAKQFQKIRQGDRLWWENRGVFTVKQRYALSSVTLSSIICANTGIKYVSSNPFQIISSYNRLVRCSRYPQLNLSSWREKTYKGAHCFGSEDEEETNQVDESDCEDPQDLQDHQDPQDLQDHQDFQDPLVVQDNAVH